MHTFHISVDFIRYGCDATMVQLRLCENIAFLLTGFDHAQANMVRILNNNQEEYGTMIESKKFFFISYLTVVLIVCRLWFPTS